MKESQVGRRKFIRTMAGTAAVISALPRKAFSLMTSGPDIRPVEKGRPEGTVKAQVSRARTKLRRLMRQALHRQPCPTTCTASPVVEKKPPKSQVLNQRAALLA